MSMLPALLFRDPISKFTNDRIKEAEAQTEALTEAQLHDPALAGTLEKISNFKFDVAVLVPENRKGKRRTTKVPRDDYGRQIMVDVDMIDVTIPFSGWPKSFLYAPSVANIIGEPILVSNGTLVVTFADDAGLDRNVDGFIKYVNENLKNLESDIKKIRQQALRTCQRIANERIARIKLQKERDKTRSFPID